MAIGRHWEWRAFGTISEAFRGRFNLLSLAYPDGEPWARVTDEYLWVPGVRINVKLRKGIEDGLKIKRLEQRDSGLELWYEKPEELYPFAQLNATTLGALARVLSIELPAIEPGPYDREKTITLLAKARPSPRIIRVDKLRQTRKLARAELVAKVEIAEITSPEVTYSVGIENDADLGPQATDQEIASAKNSIVLAIDALNLRDEKLKTMGYLEALERWGTRTSQNATQC